MLGWQENIFLGGGEVGFLRKRTIYIEDRGSQKRTSQTFPSKKAAAKGGEKTGTSDSHVFFVADFLVETANLHFGSDSATSFCIFLRRKKSVIMRAFHTDGG